MENMLQRFNCISFLPEPPGSSTIFLCSSKRLMKIQFFYIHQKIIQSIVLFSSSKKLMNMQVFYIRQSFYMKVMKLI